MAHNSYPAGRSGSAAQWPDGSTVTPDEFAWLAACAFGSINGDNGGTWAPAAVITIGGAGAAFTNTPTSFYGIECTGLAELNTVGITGDCAIVGSLTVAANTNFNGGTSGTHATLTIGQYVDSTISGSLSVTGSGSFSTALSLPAASTATFAGTVHINGTSGTHATFTIGSYTDTEFIGKVTVYNGLAQPIQTLTTSGAIVPGTRYAIGNIGAGGGFATLPAVADHPTNAVLEVINVSTDALEVREPGGATLFQLSGTSGSGAAEVRSWALVYNNGSSWLLIRWSGRLT